LPDPVLPRIGVFKLKKATIAASEAKISIIEIISFCESP